MGQVVPGTAGLVAAGVGSGQLEVIVVAAALFFALALVGIKLWFSHDQRLRKAATSGYHQRDLARYTKRGVGRDTEPSVDPRSTPLAPTFAAPTASARPGRAVEHHLPPPPAHPNAANTSSRRTSSHGPFDPTVNVVRAFDAAEAQRLRPPSHLPPSPVQPAAVTPGADLPQEVPDLPVEEEIPPPDGALPLLRQPPPSSEPEKHSSAG